MNYQNQLEEQADLEVREKAKYYPSIRYMSFCGPESTIKWLIKQVQNEGRQTDSRTVSCEDGKYR